MIKEARNAESVYNKIDEGLKTSKFDTNLKNMQSKVGSYTGSQTEEFTKAQQAVETYEKSLSAIKDHVNGVNKMSGTDLRATYDDMLRAGKTFQNVKSQLQSVTAPLSNASKEDLFYDIDTGKYDAIGAKFQKQISAFNGQNTENIIKARDAIKTYNEELGKVTAHRNGESIMDDESLNRSVANMQKAKDTAENMMQVITNTESKTLAPSVAATSSNRVLQYMENNSKAARKYGADLQYLAEQYRSMQTVEQKATNDKAFANLKSRISAEGLTGNSFFKETGRAFKQIGQFAGVYGVLQNTIMQLPYKVFSSVQDVNAAQIELTKVSDASQSDLTKYWDTAAESANKYGATISDVISSTADWSRLGYNLDDAKELSDATTLLQKVGDNMTQESSSEGMISTLKGFKMEASDAMSIVDKVNEVANTEPIDTSGLFAGLERSASSMNAANNSLEQTIALITAAKHYWLIVWRHTLRIHLIAGNSSIG